ncbi:hypothetical protein U14_01913 [Candidatus Moduliflexus flocculans]|uniref:HTH cro/C1-type domain-containing protein n=1 Tax=Candidatus Moduliflexus flocculans TaxID=1499966 RepID=A0A0S6VT37_9BACT|nr:hypothetical protein U14_01913 [Candidatus Moduliflexus flocculans]
MNNLRKRREELGLTLQEVSEKVGVHFATVSDWELDRIIPRPKNKNILAAVLDCPRESLFPDDYVPSEELPKAICGEPNSPLRIGNIEIQCYVLEDGRRVLVQTEMISALDMKYGSGGKWSSGSDRLVNFANTKAIKPFISNDLADLITSPIKFKTTRGALAYGYEATALADLCDAVLECRKSGNLNFQQVHIAERCEILMRGFARVGIIALVDEVTGYQAIRSRNALEEILDQFISKELRKWAKTFPDEFYQEMFRLRGWQYIPLKLEKPAIVH